MRAPSGGNGGKIRGRSWRACNRMCESPTGDGCRCPGRRPPWLQWGRRLSGRMAEGRLPQPPAGLQARLRRPGSAPAPRPSSPQTLRRPAKQDSSLPRRAVRASRVVSPSLRPAGGRAAGWASCSASPSSQRQRVRLPLLGRYPGPALPPGLPHLASSFLALLRLRLLTAGISGSFMGGKFSKFLKIIDLKTIMLVPEVW